MEELQYFFSYARKDSEFVLKLATELRAVGVNLWLDQLDILGGQRWDHAIEGALATCQGLIVVLSPESLASHNVMDEVSYALEEGKLVVPILLRSCAIPFRLRRVQHTDFTTDYATGFAQLLRALHIPQPLPSLEPDVSTEAVVPDIPAPATATLQVASALETLPGKTEPSAPDQQRVLEVEAPLADMQTEVARELSETQTTHPLPETAKQAPQQAKVEGQEKPQAHVEQKGTSKTRAVLHGADAQLARWWAALRQRIISHPGAPAQLIWITIVLAISVVSICEAIQWNLLWHIKVWDFSTFAIDYVIKMPISVAIGGIIGGAIGGFITGQAIRMVEPSFQWKQIVMTSVGWAIGVFIAGIMYSPLVHLWSNNDYLYLMQPIDYALVGVIGGGIMFWQLIRVRSKGKNVFSVNPLRSSKRGV